MPRIPTRGLPLNFLGGSLAILATLLPGAAHGQVKSSPAGKALVVDEADRFVEIEATYRPLQFNRAAGLKNHHFIAWEDGLAGGRALFTTPVPDSAIHDALVRIGAKPGNNLTNETWTKRNDRKSPFPDMLIEGSPVSITFRKGGETLHFEDILKDESGKHPEFRFGGNRALIPIWRSGCVVCLQSCPGGKMGNRSHSIRNLVKGIARFSLKNPDVLKNGDTVRIRFTLLSDPP